MDRDEFFIRFLVSQQHVSPHAAAYNRRQFLRRAIQLGFGASAVAFLAACGNGSSKTPSATSGGAATSAAGAASPGAGTASPAAGAATPAALTLPEITSIPDNLKGSGQVRVVSYGGAFQDAQRKAYFEPFQKLSGIKVIDSEGPDTAKVKAMVDTKNIEWDIGEFDRGDVINLEKKGDYWEPIDYSLVDTANIDEAFRYKYSLDMLPYAQIYGYRTDTFKGAKPSGWADFWDTKKFPGPRAMPGGSGGITPDLESAMMASGVEPSNVYPIDINKAYDSLTKVKKDVVKWWDAGAIPAQMLNDKEAVLATAWNGRIAAIQATGAPVEIAWEQGQLLNDAWAVPKGSPNKENAMKFIAFITMAMPQARLSFLIPYGFVNNKSAELIPADRLKILPTSPDIKSKLLIHNSQWWADNRDAVLEKWNSWILS
jgi:putative spermidine/putrescine transport system substrate-binding protein